jgi:hypothetical protein
MVRILAIRPKVRGFKPGQGDGFFKALKISCTPNLGGKADGPMSQNFTPCKRSLRVRNKYFLNEVHHFLHPDPPNLLLDVSVGRKLSDKWIGLSMFMYHQGDDNRPIGDRCSGM